MDSSSPNWHSRTESPMVVQDPDSIQWNDTTEVLVIGLGGAGISAALESLECGDRVTAIDRFDGGGATAISGGVYYGGGTSHQREAGYQDTPEEMFNYLTLEVQDAVSDETLHDFCSSSSETLEWLEKHGVKFSSSLCPGKTSYPSDKYFLYYSGNEQQPNYSKYAKPAPRGHRCVGKGLSGANFYKPLKEAAFAKGLKLYSYSEARRIILDGSGAIIGVDFIQLTESPAAQKELATINKKFASMLTLLSPKRAARLMSEADAIVEEYGKRSVIRVDKAVILCAGGFSHNREMVAHYAPKYIEADPLGGIGCNGSGIRLGQSVGGAVDRMGNISAWLNINPPAARVKGIIINGKGDRVVAEDCYGAKIGQHVVEDSDGTAFIILDRTLYFEALWQSLPRPGNNFRTQGAPALLSLLFGATVAGTIEGLASKLGIPVDRLRDSIEHHNAVFEGKQDPLFPKQDEYLRAISKPWFCALNISIGSKTSYFPAISLGGLAIDEKTGQVLSVGGDTIPKLYAAGRNARGVASNLYVSGLSIADCVFSGRRAGRICRGD